MNGDYKMSKTLKWILYILLGLVALAVVAGIVFMVFGGYGYGMMRPGIRMMEPYYYHSPVRLIFGGLLCLGVILLVIVGIVALVNALTHSNRSAQTAPPAQMTAQPAEMTNPSHTCSNCGKPAQEDWKTCPYCGNPLA
jgi:uncharacterized membrane protein